MSRGRRAAAAVLAAVTLFPVLGGCSGAGRDPAPGTPRPGAAGVDDPYLPKAGNGGIDVRHYSLDLDYGGSRLRATAMLKLTATQSLSRFDLDFQGLTVQSVSVAGTAARFTMGGGELVITPARPIPRGTTVTTEVRYSGTPRPLDEGRLGRVGWIPTDDDGAFVASEPDGSRTWFPANDHPSDKATYDITIAVPPGLTALSNGILRDRRTMDGRTLFAWRETHPMATYLATATIGRFDLRQGSSPGGIPVLAAADPQLSGELGDLYDDTAKITDAWTDEFGPYPFSETGGIADVVQGADYALENQTKPLYGMRPDAPVIAHELAHQWFGDDVTPRTWKDVWLNEGFATYAEWLWQARTGDTSLQQAFDTAFAAPDADAIWTVPPADPGPPQMFGNSVYDRGGMTLVALRDKIGAGVFGRLLRAWVRRHRYGNATTGDFVRLAEQVSGRDLGPFFQQWLYRRGKPRNW